jgi:hypothetical protein
MEANVTPPTSASVHTSDRKPVHYGGGCQQSQITSRSNRPMKVIAWLLTLGLIGFAIYLPGIGIPYYEDDLQFIFDPTPPSFLYYFSHKNPQVGFYRPIEATTLSFIQYYFALNTAPIHIILITLHISLSSLIFFTILKLGYSYIHAIIGSLFMVVSQANAFAVLSNDTLSQVNGTLFGCISLFFLYMFYGNRELVKNRVWDIKRSGYYIISVFAFGVSLLSKESSISFFPLLLAIIATNNLKIKGNDNFSAKELFIALLPYIITLSSYVIIRLLLGVAQPSSGSTRYNFHIGINVIKNLVMFLFALTIPASSVSAFVALRSNEVIRFLMFATSSLVFVSCIVYVLWNSNRKSIIVLMATFAIAALFPMAMLNHVSELYVYNSMPFLSILVGISLGEILKISYTDRIMQTTLLILLIFLAASHIIAIQDKIAFMQKNGERATALISQIGLYIDKVPRSGKLLLLNPSENVIEYSQFLLKGFNVVNYGKRMIKRIYGRDDITIKIIEQNHIDQSEHSKDALILTLTGDLIVIYQENQ